MLHNCSAEKDIQKVHFFPGPMLWMFSFAVLVFDFLWIFISPLSFHVPSLVGFVVVGLALACGAWFYRFKRSEPQFYVLFLGVFFLISLSQGLALLSYIFISFAFPLQDATYSHLDKIMGFDWLAYQSFVNSDPLFSKILMFAYHSTIFQLIGLVLLFSFLNRVNELRQFFQLFFFTGLIVISIAGLFPAVAPYAYYQPGPEFFSNFGPLSGRYHEEHLFALREGTMGTIDLLNMQGLISFPSFHTCLALITVWGTRHFRYIFPFSIVLNGLVLMGTMPEGGHYLIDLIGGALITLVVLGGLNRHQIMSYMSDKLRVSLLNQKPIA